MCYNNIVRVFAVSTRKPKGSTIMKDSKLLPRKYRRQARRDQKQVDAARVATSGIVAHGYRKMARLDWEGTRSPSRLGRAGERAQQASAVITPAAASATALIALAGAGFDLYAKYRAWMDRTQPTPPPAGSGHNQNDEPPF